MSDNTLKSLVDNFSSSLVLQNNSRVGEIGNFFFFRIVFVFVFAHDLPNDSCEKQ